MLVEDAHIRPMMGFEILEPLPTRSVPYERLDPFILVHESRLRLSELTDVDTKHPASRVRQPLVHPRGVGQHRPQHGARRQRSSGRGCPRARCSRSGPGAVRGTPRRSARRSAGRAMGDTEWRSVLFWVNLARKDKQVEPSAQVLLPEQMTVRGEGDATVRVLVGEGSPVQPGDACHRPRRRAPGRRRVHDPRPIRVPGLRLHARRRRHVRCEPTTRRGPHSSSCSVQGRGSRVRDAAPGTRFLLMAGKPYGEAPVFNGPYVD